MAPPVEGSATSTTTLEVTWGTVSSLNDGGSTVTSYNLYWDQGIGSWVTLVGQSSSYLGTSYTIGVGIMQGATYTFKVRAENMWGFGPFSTTTSIVASTVPSQVTNVTTLIDPTTGNVLIQWSGPSSNGAAITAYLI